MVSRRRRGGRGRWVMIVGAGLLLAGAWAFWPGGVTDATASDGSTEADRAFRDAAATTNDRDPTPPIAALPETPLSVSPPTAPRTEVAPEVRAPAASGSLSEAIERRAEQPPSVTSSTPPPSPPPPAATASAPAPEPRRPAPSVTPSEPGDLASARAELIAAERAARTEAQRSAVRRRLASAQAEALFSPKVFPGIWETESYEVRPGDTLAQIARKRDLTTDWRLIQRVNELRDPSRIRVGQSLKLVRGPFHAVVSKSGYRLDVFHGPPDERSEWMYIASFPVGLGEYDGTPIGTFRVRPASKLVNPYWINPRTGEHYDANNPENPIGEHWIGLEGLGDTAVFTGYGIHGTIEPDSIGTQASMGCVRMLAEDVAFIYELLVEGVSLVVIEE